MIGVGDRIRMLREKILDMNQNEFAELLGVVQTTISTAENKDRLSRKLADRMIENVDGLKIDWIKTGEGEIFETYSKYKKSETVFKQIKQNNKGKNNRQNMIAGGNSEELISSLKAQIEWQAEQLRVKDEQLKVKDEQLKAKDEQIRIRDEQIKAKEEQVNQLLAQLFKNN